MSLNVVLVNYTHEHVHDLVFDVWTHLHEFAIHAVQDGFQIVTLARVLTIEKFKEAVDKVVRDVLDDHVMTQMACENELKQELVDKLQVRPGLLKMRFVLIRVNRRSLLVIYTNVPLFIQLAYNSKIE